jgi:hypothetical protein
MHCGYNHAITASACIVAITMPSLHAGCLQGPYKVVSNPFEVVDLLNKGGHTTLVASPGVATIDHLGVPFCKVT